MGNFHLAVIALVACASGNARTITANASSVCDSLPSATCKDDLPPLEPWDGKPLPPPKTDHGTVLIHPDLDNPGSLIAVSIDDGTIAARVKLPSEDLSKLVLLLVTDDQQKTDAGVHYKALHKVTPSGGPRKPSAEYYRQAAAIEQLASDIANERAAQCQ